MISQNLGVAKKFITDQRRNKVIIKKFGLLGTEGYSSWSQIIWLSSNSIFYQNLVFSVLFDVHFSLTVILYWINDVSKPVFTS